MYQSQTGSMAFDGMSLESWATYFIFFGFILNAAAPPLHAWLPDAYPEATVTGTVFLSAFTTKTAVYVLARSFAGTEILIWIGVMMTLYGIVWAILENDMRRILAYSIINQVGFMITGIGIGTQMALNGTISHAFCHILYKALLLMSAGAVLHMTGKTKCTDLGGLYKTMPLTLMFALVGAASISAFPLFSGFVSKAMVITASTQENMPFVWLMLTLASAGVFLHAGIKFPYFVFFAKDSGIRTQEPPNHMLWAMGLLSFLCIFLGVVPGVLYAILPFPVNFVPYTLDHVLSQLQLLAFSALAFFLLLPHLQRTKTISLDTDWFYRKGAQALVWFLNQPGVRIGNQFGKIFFEEIPRGLFWLSQNPLAAIQIGFEKLVVHVGRWAGSSQVKALEKKVKTEQSLYPGDQVYHWPIGTTVLWVTLFLLGSLLLYYL
jgi:multicomponent Na+:H+ antiporter subunit D